MAPLCKSAPPDSQSGLLPWWEKVLEGRMRGQLNPDPFARRAASIPVTVVADFEKLAHFDADGTAVVRLEPPLHDHAPGTECVACESRGNVRVLLFELDEKVRRGMVPPFSRVVVDATGIADPQAVADAIVPGRLPAMGLRDHTVARNFHLDRVI